ncbi:hypothetical protein E1B28_008207 [Marasmius oreades]|uniref:AAA+ ATPase domain-containing protein n=1 Tax=Marasmius oreades TaxID=181124 RepID=A0A9P7UU22_9AGAR|nr:uncharacterized protein E1B28_008207 [Marasmius oreades]KAG7091804.1 hypothetical protein E1B28_008207 [Marasmius oreades]
MFAPEMQAITYGRGAAAKLYATIDRIPDINSTNPNDVKPSSLEHISFASSSHPDVTVLRALSFTLRAGTTAPLSEAYKELQSLIGLASTKATIDSLVTLVQVNNERQLKGKKSVEVLLNRVFLGPPGTGKTTVAKLYAKLLNEMGLLSTGEVVTKNANDFIGQFIGQSEANTKAILASAKGKVLIIDEAHILNPTSYNNADVFKEDVIDSLVSGIQNMPGDDQCVLLLGYEEEMFEMFENANPGLNRRFRISDSFYFPDFTTDGTSGSARSSHWYR